MISRSTEMVEALVEHEGASVTCDFVRDSSSASKLPDRRAQTRESIRFASLDFGNGHEAAILDISEGGLAVQSIRRLDTYSFLKMRLRLSRSAPWVEVSGRFVWMNHSKRVAGIEFVQISAGAQNQIRNWSQDAKSLNAPPGSSSLVEPFFVMRRVPTHVPARYALACQPQNRSRKTPASVRCRLVSLMTKAAVFTMGLVLIGPYWGGPLLAPQRREPLAPVGLRSSPARDLPAPAMGRAQTAASAQTEVLRPTVTPGLKILQVATMRHKENAEVLSSTLRSKGFPVLVFQPDSSYFFVVVAGPFSGANSVSRARIALKKQGFDAIARPWPWQ
jgi:PilZ domain/SPOR domain